MMQIHVGTGVTALALVAIHAGQRPVSVHRADLGRRALLRAGGLLGAAGLVYLAAEGAWRLAGLPGGQRRFTGSHEISSISDVPATQWLNDRVPVLNGNAHVVRVGTSRYTIGRLASFGDQITATLDCTGGWHTTQTWSGTSLHRLLEPGAGARSVVVRSVTGYWRRFPVSDARQLLLATHVAGQPLRSGHGAPLRLVAPGRRGFWWVKWVEVVEIDDLPPWWQPPLPTA